jgi:DNA-binding transcriptional ArsR family regulator
MTIEMTSGELPQPAREKILLTDVLHALSDPIRLDMVRQLDECGGERTCGSFNLPIAKSTSTHHWRVLRECGLVTTREDGTRRYQSLRREDVDARFPALLDSVLAAS